MIYQSLKESSIHQIGTNLDEEESKRSKEGIFNIKASIQNANKFNDFFKQFETFKSPNTLKALP